jgi:hypothetical protein
VFRLTIDREWDARPAREGPWFRARLRAADGSVLMVHNRLCQSIEEAIEHTEVIFGPLEWRRKAESASVVYDWLTQRTQIAVPSQ